MPVKPNVPTDRKMKKQLSHKFLTPIQKNEQLFDAIHNYLDNPKKGEVEFNSQKIVRDRAELEEKLKEYEEKLSKSPAEHFVRPK
jgi:hypothetical protein